MGEMILRNLDDALLIELHRMAKLRGVEAEELAANLLREHIAPPPAPRRDRAAEAHAIQALQPRPSPFDSTKLIREDRDRGWS